MAADIYAESICFTHYSDRFGVLYGLSVASFFRKRCWAQCELYPLFEILDFDMPSLVRLQRNYSKW